MMGKYLRGLAVEEGARNQAMPSKCVHARRHPPLNASFIMFWDGGAIFKGLSSRGGGDLLGKTLNPMKNPKPERKNLNPKENL